MGLFLLLSMLQFFVALNFATFHRDEWPEADTSITWRSTCLTYDVKVYAYDFGFDQFVMSLAPGQTVHMQSHLGQKFFALSPQEVFLGNFTVHWDINRPPTKNGESRRFNVQCPDDYLYLCPACNRDLVLTPSMIKSHGFTSHTARDKKDIGRNSVEEAKHYNNLARVRMSQKQRVHPQVKKYTRLGFKTGMKFKDISPEGWEKIVEFYNRFKDSNAEVTEPWDISNIYVNHWEAKSTMIHLPDEVKRIMWKDMSKAVGEWAGVDGSTLEGSSIYGIRRYWNGSVLMNHVDRGDVLVLSAIINVDQGTMDEPWPLQVYDHELKPHIVFMKPGDCLFYESASVIHGRPLPLKGEFMANIFAHTKPLEWTFEMPNY